MLASQSPSNLSFSISCSAPGFAAGGCAATDATNMPRMKQHTSVNTLALMMHLLERGAIAHGRFGANRATKSARIQLHAPELVNACITRQGMPCQAFLR